MQKPTPRQGSIWSPDEGTRTYQTKDVNPGSAKGAALTPLTSVTLSASQGDWALSLTRGKTLETLVYVK